MRREDGGERKDSREKGVQGGGSPVRGRRESSEEGGGSPVRKEEGVK